MVGIYRRCNHGGSQPRAAFAPDPDAPVYRFSCAAHHPVGPHVDRVPPGARTFSHSGFGCRGLLLMAISNKFGSMVLTTTFPDEPENVDIVTGDWRPIDLTKPPFDLSDRGVEVVVLREMEELSYKEIANVVDLPLGTVMSRLSRAREQLRRHYGRLEAGSPAFFPELRSRI